MKQTSSPLGIDLDGAYEKTPAGFSLRLAHSLKNMAGTKPEKKRTHRLVIMAVCLALLCGGALAAGSLGVLDFLTGTTMPVDRAALEDSVQKPLSQSYDGKQIAVSVRDFVWNNMRLSIVLHAEPGKPDQFHLLSQSDFGVDGMNMDNIWWGDEITTLKEWLPKGKQALVVDLSRLNVGGVDILPTRYQVPEEDGETFFLSVDLIDVTPEQYEKMLDENGDMQVTVPVSCWVYGSLTKEESTLTITAAAPSKQEWRTMYDSF